MADFWDVRYAQFIPTNKAVRPRPVLGMLGLPMMAPFETVIDYTHQRLTLIPVDTAGRRLVAVPMYTPVTTLPMTRNELGGDALVRTGRVAGGGTD